MESKELAIGLEQEDLGLDVVLYNKGKESSLL